MTQTKKKFGACLLRDTTSELIVAEWHQLVTTVDKSKLQLAHLLDTKNRRINEKK